MMGRGFCASILNLDLDAGGGRGGGEQVVEGTREVMAMVVVEDHVGGSRCWAVNRESKKIMKTRVKVQICACVLTFQCW